MRLPLWLKVGWTLWVAVWAPLYWKQYGAQNFLYFCDLGNFFIAIALWTESALLFSWQATGLLLFQILFTLDLLTALLFGKHFIGGTEFMFDPAVPLFIRLLSLFHVVTPPLLLWAIRRFGYDERGWKYQTLTTWTEHDVNWVRGLFYREQHTLPGLVYLMAYLIVLPLVIYYPTHLALRWWSKRWRET